MSSTRMPYDNCYVKQKNKQSSTEPAAYQFFGGKYENRGLCDSKNTVCDLPLSTQTMNESKLMNLDPKNSKCDTKQGGQRPPCKEPPCSEPNPTMFTPVRVFDKLILLGGDKKKTLSASP